MRALGDKIQSKHIAKAAGVNTVPGYVGEVETVEDAIRIGTPRHTLDCSSVDCLSHPR